MIILCPFTLKWGLDELHRPVGILSHPWRSSDGFWYLRGIMLLGRHI